MRGIRKWSKLEPRQNTSPFANSWLNATKNDAFERVYGFACVFHIRSSFQKPCYIQPCFQTFAFGWPCVYTNFYSFVFYLSVKTNKHSSGLYLQVFI
jgi:hypothetical protein